MSEGQSRTQSFLELVRLPLRLRFDRGEIDYAAYRAQSPSAPELAAFEGERGRVELCGRALAEVLVRDSDGGSKLELQGTALGPGEVEDFVLDARFTVAVVVGERLMGVEEAEGLAAGGLVALDRLASEPLDLVLEEPPRLLARGEIVTLDGSYAIRVTEPLLPEPDAGPDRDWRGPEPRAAARLVLGRGELSLREAAALEGGSIVQLDARAGDPARLEIGCASLAADVVVEGERFAARLLPKATIVPHNAPSEDAGSGLEPLEPAWGSAIEALGAELRDLAGSVREELAGFRDELAGLRGELRAELRAGLGAGSGASAPEGESPSRAGELAAAATLAADPDQAARGLGALLESGDRRSAALALAALGSDLSAEIFKRLDEGAIEGLTFEIARLEAVGDQERAAALAKLHSFALAAAAEASGGIDYAREVLEKALGAQGAIDVINKLTDSLQARPFDFVGKADPERILDAVMTEHPQTAALVLSCLEPDKAAFILRRMPRDAQADIARRVATMGPVSCEPVREAERVLERKLADEDSGNYLELGGPDSVVELLNLVDRATEKQVIETLEEEDPELAEELKKRMFVFEDLVILDDRSIQKVLREIEARDLALALRGVDGEVAEKIFRNMSKRAALMLKEDIEYLGPVRLADIEAAQQRIIAIVRALEESGEIVIGRAEDEIRV